MKNNIKFLALICISLAFTSCLVEEDSRDDQNDQGNNLLGFVEAQMNASVTTDGSETDLLLPIQLAGPTATGYTGEFTATIEVDPSSTAVEGVHYTLSASTVTISSDNNLIGNFPLTIITEGILPPLDENPFLILNITSASDSSVVPNGRTSSININIEYLCFSMVTGKYRALFGEYYRIGVGPNCTASDWPDETEIIYLCGTTYRVLEWFGCFDGNEWYFEIAEDGTITYPALTPSGDPQSGNGQPLITCQTNPGDMTNVPCGAGSNMMTVDGDVVTLNMSYGYFTDGSGSREFTHILEKITD